MRARLMFLLLALLAVAGFAALNWPEFQRTTRLNFGVFTMDGSLGIILLTLLGLGVLTVLVSSGVLRSRMMVTENRYTRELQAQRELADRAEASRFTELRQYLDGHFRESRQRDALVSTSTEFEKSMLQSQREMRNQIEQVQRMLTTRLGDSEPRFGGGARVEKVSPAVDLPNRPVDRPLPPREVKA